MNSHQRKLYHFGAQRLCRSTLSDANNKRDYRIYQDLFYSVLEKVQQMAPKYKLKLPRKLYIMDSTTINLCLKLFPWARFRKTKAAIRIHALMQADGSLPTFLQITDGKIHDNNAAKSFHVPPGSFLAIDRGYNDYKQYKYYTLNNIRFVTRLKRNATTRVVKTLPDRSDQILSDQIVIFTGLNAASDYPFPIRKICFYDPEKKNELIFLTNELKLDAQTIADIYKARWEIELFFKTIKQNLKIKRFLGTSRNAVSTQIWIAMIAYLMISYQKFSQRTKYSIQKIFKLIQTNLFERKLLEDILTDKLFKPPAPKINNQLILFNF
jgi:putative transposase